MSLVNLDIRRTPIERGTTTSPTRYKLVISGEATYEECERILAYMFPGEKGRKNDKSQD
jgi:hypothetical protein